MSHQETELLSPSPVSGSDSCWFSPPPGHLCPGCSWQPGFWEVLSHLVFSSASLTRWYHPNHQLGHCFHHSWKNLELHFLEGKSHVVSDFLVFIGLLAQHPVDAAGSCTHCACVRQSLMCWAVTRTWPFPNQVRHGY